MQLSGQVQGSQLVDPAAGETAAMPPAGTTRSGESLLGESEPGEDGTDQTSPVSCEAVLCVPELEEPQMFKGTNLIGINMDWAEQCRSELGVGADGYLLQAEGSAAQAVGCASGDQELQGSCHGIYDVEGVDRAMQCGGKSGKGADGYLPRAEESAGPAGLGTGGDRELPGIVCLVSDTTEGDWAEQCTSEPGAGADIDLPLAGELAVQAVRCTDGDQISQHAHGSGHMASDAVGMDRAEQCYGKTGKRADGYLPRAEESAGPAGLSTGGDRELPGTVCLVSDTTKWDWAEHCTSEPGAGADIGLPLAGELAVQAVRCTDGDQIYHGGGLMASDAVGIDRAEQCDGRAGKRADGYLPRAEESVGPAGLGIGGDRELPGTDCHVSGTAEGEGATQCAIDTGGRADGYLLPADESVESRDTHIGSDDDLLVGDGLGVEQADRAEQITGDASSEADRDLSRTERSAGPASTASYRDLLTEDPLTGNVTGDSTNSLEATRVRRVRWQCTVATAGVRAWILLVCVALWTHTELSSANTLTRVWGVGLRSHVLHGLPTPGKLWTAVQGDLPP